MSMDEDVSVDDEDDERIAQLEDTGVEPPQGQHMARLLFRLEQADAAARIPEGLYPIGK
jgi:hypothetical protein